MINLYESKIELSVAAVYESLKTRNKCHSELDAAGWNDFAKKVNLPEVSESISRKQAYLYLNEYLKNGTASVHTICEYFDWNDMQTVESDLIKAEKSMEDAVEYPDVIDKIIKISDKITKIIFKNNWYMALIYDDEYVLERVHVSVESSFHKSKTGLHDFAEVGFYKDKICVNLDSHKEYDDNNGYNNLYDLYISSAEYDFSKYKNLAEQVAFYN